MLKDRLQQDPLQTMQPLDAWRKTLAAKMHVGDNAGSDQYYLHMRAMSYRYECILCRLISRQYKTVACIEWAKQKQRSAMLELDTIAMRVLAGKNVQDLPISL